MPRARAAKKEPELPQDELTRKEELIRTAVELFSVQGFKGTSIRDIARSQGISVSNMYHYFENKEDLLFASQEYLVRWMPEQLDAVWQESSDPLERFKLLLKVHLAAIGCHHKESKIFMMDQSQLSKKGNVRNRKIQIRLLDLYVKHVESLQQAGYVTMRHTKILAFNILAVINWYLRWYKPDGPLPAEEVFNEIIAFILNGVMVKASPAATRRKPK